MGTETVIYLTNIIICAIIAALMTEAWLHSANRPSLKFWMVAAWIMLVADILFAARVLLPPVIDRIVPTVLVTVGQTVLWFGAQIAAGQTIRPRRGLAIIVVHTAALIAFFLIDPSSPWRRVVNGLIWSGLAILSYRGLPPATTQFCPRV